VNDYARSENGLAGSFGVAHRADPKVLFRTPPEGILPLLPHLPKKPRRCLEPCAGDGSIIKTLASVGYALSLDWTAVEVREEERAGLEQHADRVEIADARVWPKSHKKSRRIESLRGQIATGTRRWSSPGWCRIRCKDCH